LGTPKWTQKDKQRLASGGLYGPISKLYKKLFNQIIRLILLGEILQNNQKTGVFCNLGNIWAPPNVPKKVHKGLQMSGLYGLMSNLENNPLNKSLGLFFQKKRPKTNRKQNHQMDPKGYSKACK
jgi:hypothetical protein